MWGLGGWTGGDEQESARALDRAVETGCNFFDTAWAYGDGRSEQLLGELLRRHPDRELYVATKVPPANREWPGKRTTPAARVFPYEHIVQYTTLSLRNLGVSSLDLQQLHVWDDSWTAFDGWKEAVHDLKQQGLIRAFGISVNRWEPANVLDALDTGLVDVVQVVYNIFDQAPEDVLFPACARLGVALIARVPFDEGSLTGTLAPGTRWPDGDWRNTYFGGTHLTDTLRRVAPLRAIADTAGLSLPELALRFILSNRDVTTTIPGMRRTAHVDENLRSSDAGPLPAPLRQELRAHRWDRLPDDRP